MKEASPSATSQRATISRAALVIALAAFVVPALAPLQRLNAATTAYSWNGGNGNFSDPSKWTPSGFPSSNSDSATFNNGTTETVTFAANATSGGIASGGASLTITGNTNLTLNLAGKTYDALAFNNVRAAGAITTISIASNLIVSSSVAGGLLEDYNASTTGSGTLVTSISGGASVQINASAGFGASWINDGAFQVTGNLSSLTVDGAGSTLSVVRGGLATAASAGGSVSATVSNGGKIFSAGTQLGTNAPSNLGTSTITVTGTGSELQHTNGGNAFFIGRSGATVLNISSAGLVSYAGASGASQTTFVSDPNGTETTTVNLTGTNSTLQSRSLQMGNAAGTGSAITAGFNATVNVGTGTFLQATNASGSGIGLQAKSLLNLSGGTVQMADGRSLSLTTVSGAASHATLRGVGTIERISGTNLISLQNTSGFVRPGDISATPATGLLTFNNTSFNNASGGTLFLDLLAMNSHDQMRFIDTLNTGAATTTATLNGTLTYNTTGFVAAPGSIDFVIAESITYAPTADNLPAYLASLTLPPTVLNYQYGVTTIGATDYAGGQFAGYQALRLTFVPIPEPASFVLFAAGVVLLARRPNGCRRKIA